MDNTKIKGSSTMWEERFIADYFLSYGKLINSIYPEQLKTLVLNGSKNCASIMTNYKNKAYNYTFVRLINLIYNRPVAVLM